MRGGWVLGVVGIGCALAACPRGGAEVTAARAAPRLRVVERLTLPAETFAPGPPSGARLAGVHGAPWASQPVQGFSALLAEPDGGLLALTDNGYGAPETSSDFLLRVYELSADGGTLAARERFTLRDPDARIPWPIVHHFTAERLLTGADLDPESMVRAPDGTFWFGDELGPFLVHTDATGRLLEPPAPLGGCDVVAQLGDLDAEAAAQQAASARRGDQLRQLAQRVGHAAPCAEEAVRSVDDPRLPENLALESLEALRADALAHGAPAPWLSPDERLVSPELVTRARRAGFRVVPWTVNEPARMGELAALGVDGLITDRPDLAARLPLDGGALDVQGHRGARGLRPENTLPAFEAALDQGVTTLELDLTATADGSLVWHDATLDGRKCRSTDGSTSLALTRADADTAEQRWRCDRLQPGFPDQRNEPTLSPATSAFAPTRRLGSLYAPVGLERLLAFLSWYQGYYAVGDGRNDVSAARRVATAKAVRLNVETKVHGTGAPHDEPVWLTRHLGDVLARTNATARASLQSFDWRSLRTAAAELPALQTVALLGSGNIAGPAETRAGLPWPAVAGAPRVGRSGGFESLALAPDGTVLYAMLEKPLPGRRELLAFAFDLAARRFTGVAWRYPLAADAAAVGDLAIGPDGVGWALERDEGEGPTARHKTLVRFALPRAPGGVVRKEVVADLLALDFPFTTPEGVALLPGGRVAVVADNNYPFGRARHPGTDVADATELLVLAPE